MFIEKYFYKANLLEIKWGGSILEEVLEVGQELRLNPYVTQTEKLTTSLRYLTKIFRDKVEFEDIRTLEIQHIAMISEDIKKQVCNRCDNQGTCSMYQLNNLESFTYEVVADIEEFGAELSISKKRKFEKHCTIFGEVKMEILKRIWDLKRNRMWEMRMAQNQDASLMAMQAFVTAVEESTKEIDASIFEDDYLERKIRIHLKRIGIRTLKIVLFVSREGIYEVHISAKAKKGNYVTTKQMGVVISKVLGRTLIPEKKERLVLKEAYTTLVFIERQKYQTFCGVSQQKKKGSNISGDNFLISEMPGGKVCAMVSDGMGSGSRAYRKSKLLLELGEKLLEANISPKVMLEMMNAALITDGNEVEFATLDMCTVDVYKGEIDLIKAGASSTYIVTPYKCECFDASSLPMGVVAGSEVNCYKYKVDESCYIVIVTDGVKEAIKEKETEFIYRVFMNAKTQNTKDLAAILLEKVLELQCGVTKDDMMVLVLGVWELQF